MNQLSPVLNEYTYTKTYRIVHQRLQTSNQTRVQWAIGQRGTIVHQLQDAQQIWYALQFNEAKHKTERKHFVHSYPIFSCSLINHRRARIHTCEPMFSMQFSMHPSKWCEIRFSHWPHGWASPPATIVIAAKQTKVHINLPFYRQLFIKHLHSSYLSIGRCNALAMAALSTTSIHLLCRSDSFANNKFAISFPVANLALQSYLVLSDPIPRPIRRTWCPIHWSRASAGSA